MKQMNLHVYLTGSGKPETIPLPEKDVVIGSARDADIVLDHKDVSPYQARLSKQGIEWTIEDLDASVVTLIDKRPLLGKRVLKPDSTIEIGHCKVVFTSSGNQPETIPVPAAKPKSPPEKPTVPSPVPQPPAPQPRSRESSLVHKNRAKYDEYKAKIHRLMVDNLRLINLLEVDESTKQEAVRIVSELVAKNPPPPGLDRKRIEKEVFDEAFGLGPLEDLLVDPEITEVMVNRRDQIYIERHGKLTLTDTSFSSDDKVRLVIDRIVTPLGRRIDESSPLVDARLADGSRVNAVIPPLSIKGPCITIRKFPERTFGIDELVGFGSMTREMGEFFALAVKNRKNIVISGGTGSGKTTLLNVVSSFIPDSERIVTIEDAAELRLPQEHVVSLESKPASIEGKGAIGIRELVINALRMRPDRIVVGECRGKEALDMLQAMNTGHDGSLTTAHANSTRDVLARLETMVLMAGMDLPVRAIREQISSAIDIVIQQSRMPDGTRKIIDVVEVTGMEGDKILLQQYFYFKQEGYDADGRLRGRFICTGLIPNFVQEMRERGIPVDLTMFRETEEDTR
jgi:pilus assembly protein CpaF